MQPTLWSAVTAVTLGCAVAQGAQAPARDPGAAILAAHRTADEAYLKAPMSPFTAVAVQYFLPGQSFRLGIGPSGVEFDAAPGGADVVELTLDGGVFVVTPVKGAPPALAKTSGDGGVSPERTPISGKTRLARGDVVVLGRCLVEFNVSPGNGNARVFDPESPARKAFTGLKWYPPNPALQVKARFGRSAAPSPVTIITSRGLQREYFRVGTFEFAIDGRRLRLTALAVSPTLKDGDELFLAFRDQTTGGETYDVGRYLFVPFAGADVAYVLDFNNATNPLCNYSPHYNCPIPLRENQLPVPIRAGERKYPAQH